MWLEPGQGRPFSQATQRVGDKIAKETRDLILNIVLLDSREVITRMGILSDILQPASQESLSVREGGC
jgi:hypothetical protein